MLRKSLFGAFAIALLLLSRLAFAAVPDLFDGAIQDARYVDALPLKGQLFHVQGVALDGSHLWVTSVDLENHRGYLHEFDRASGAFLRRIELTDGVRYHPGGLSISGRSIWVPVAELRPGSSAVLTEIDADTLQIRRRIAVPDHLGCVAASPRTLVAGNWDSRLLYVIDLAHPDRYRTIPNPSPTRYQDMKFVGDELVAGGTTGWSSGSLDWLDWPSGKLVRSLHSGSVDAVRPFGRGGPYTSEGMAIAGRDVYLLPEDGPSRLFHFRLDALAVMLDARFREGERD